MEVKLQGENATGDYYLRCGRRSRNARLTCDQVLEIRVRHKKGEKMAEIAKDYPVGYGAIQSVCTYETYSYCK